MIKLGDKVKIVESPIAMRWIGHIGEVTGIKTNTVTRNTVFDVDNIPDCYFQEEHLELVKKEKAK